MKLKTRVHNVGWAGAMNEILELGELSTRGEDVHQVSTLLVEKIARIMETEVCSIYLIDPQTRELVLIATKGLNPESVGRVRMQIGEGLVGKAVEWLKPVSMATARKSPQFKYFPETGEERFSSLLAVPLIYNRKAIGVLVVQNREPMRYSTRAVHLLLTLAIPAVNVIEKWRLFGILGQISGRKETESRAPRAALETLPRKEGLMHEGIGASPGIAIGPVKIIRKHLPVPNFPRADEPIHADVEKMRLLEAIRWVEEELREVQGRAKSKFGLEELSIFDAYRMILESDPFREQILGEIEGGKSALKAIESVVQSYTDELAKADEEYIRERAFDIQDVGRKLTHRLLYGSENPLAPAVLDKDSILLSQEWSVSDFVEMDLDKTKGILSPSGGASSHVAILAKSLRIPTVLGLSSFGEAIRDGDRVILDGTTGLVILNPQVELIRVYEKERREEQIHREHYLQSARKKALPRGGKRISMGANLSIVNQVPVALANGAEEIGLYRTEFPFLLRRNLPTEEEQYQLYRKVLEGMKEKPVTIRTLDIGGDKYLPYLNLPREDNPFLGWRSIRISLEREDLFRIQLRALLRASVHGRLRLLFPMISSVEEIRRVKEIVGDVRRELKSQRMHCARTVPLGIMIEVPAAVGIAEALAREVQFFSIGSNDLIQYTLAVDRNNPKVAKLYQPLHPAVLKLVSRTIEAAHDHGKPVGVCGDMASAPTTALLLAGMGIDALSMSSPQVPRIKNLILRCLFQDLRNLSNEALKRVSAKEVRDLVEDFMMRHDLGEFIHHTPPLS